MTPAELVIKLFGVRPLARYLDIDHATVLHWQRTDSSGIPGLIPSKYHQDILGYAYYKKVKLTPREIIYGRKARISKR